MYNPQLETFLCVVEAGSFNKAAERLYISPPAVIKQMCIRDSHQPEQAECHDQCRYVWPGDPGGAEFHRSEKDVTKTSAGRVLQLAVRRQRVGGVEPLIRMEVPSTTTIDLGGA